jgi:hypothetical protein
MGYLMEIVVTGNHPGQRMLFSEPALFVGLHVMVLLIHGRTLIALIHCSVVLLVTQLHGVVNTRGCNLPAYCTQ